MPTAPFKRAVAVARGKPGNRRETSDPDRAQANLIARDLLMADSIAREARARGLTLIEVDGSAPLAAMIARVEEHFAPLLAAWRDVQSAGDLPQPSLKGGN